MEKLSRLATEANALPQASAAQVAHINELTAQIAQEYTKTAGMDLDYLRAGADALVLGRGRSSPLIEFGKSVFEEVLVDFIAFGFSSLAPRIRGWLDDIGIGPDERARQEEQSRQGEETDELCRAVEECCAAIEEITSVSDSSTNILLDLIMMPLMIARIHPGVRIAGLVLDLAAEGLAQVKSTTKDRNSAIEACLAACTERCNTVQEKQPAPVAQFECPPVASEQGGSGEEHHQRVDSVVPPATQPAAVEPSEAPEVPGQGSFAASSAPPAPPLEVPLPSGNPVADGGAVSSATSPMAPCNLQASQVLLPEPLSPEGTAWAIAVAGTISAIGAAAVMGGIDVLLQCVEAAETACSAPQPQPERTEAEPVDLPGPPLAEGTLPPPPQLAEVAQPQAATEKAAMHAATDTLQIQPRLDPEIVENPKGPERAVQPEDPGLSARIKKTGEW
ncbi:hypothetical protein [Corynebacterium mayonis]|uniref:hypothetical protein n=1 Tax=Corynebacterium mayonis TaxID=3062461 RepID=UPI003140274C